jgi:FMN reductase [NAD(P)H]
MWNKTIEQLQNRKSIREFTGERVSDEDLELIFKTAQRAPTSINAQQISLVYTRDKEKIKKIAELSGGQNQIAIADIFVAIVIDFNRTNHAAIATNRTQVVEKTAEGILMGAIDAGIVLNHLQSSAEALGYGTTAIGGIRANSDDIIKLFGLPKRTFVAVGSTIGVPTQNAKNAPLKPRVPFESFVMEEVYDEQKVKDGVYAYNKEFKEFRDKTGSGTLPTYFEITASTYEKSYFRKTGKVLEAQGFKFSDEI